MISFAYRSRIKAVSIAVNNKLWDSPLVMKLLLMFLLLSPLAFAQTKLSKSATPKSKTKQAELGPAFSRAALKTLYAIRDRSDERYEALENTEVESDKRPSENTMLANLRTFDLTLAFLSEVETYMFQLAIDAHTPAKKPTDKAIVAVECYRVLEASFRNRIASEWPAQCSFKP